MWCSKTELDCLVFVHFFSFMEYDELTMPCHLYVLCATDGGRNYEPREKSPRGSIRIGCHGAQG